jgi:hypothetical protein
MELSYHRLCLNKGDIIMSELEACVTLFEYLTDHADRSSIENEITKDYVRSFILEDFLMKLSSHTDNRIFGDFLLFFIYLESLYYALSISLSEGGT